MTKGVAPQQINAPSKGRGRGRGRGLVKVTTQNRASPGSINQTDANKECRVSQDVIPQQPSSKNLAKENIPIGELAVELDSLKVTERTGSSVKLGSVSSNSDLGSSIPQTDSFSSYASISKEYSESPRSQIVAEPSPASSNNADPIPQLPFATRPGFGKLGTEVKLLSNHFQLKVPMGLTLYRYDVEVRERRQFNSGLVHCVRSVDRVEREARRQRYYTAFRYLTERNPDFFSCQENLYYNRDKMLFTAKPLPLGGLPENKRKFAIKLNEGLSYDFEIAFTGKVDMNMMPYLDPDDIGTERDTNPLQILDVIFNQKMYDAYDLHSWIPSGRSFYHRNEGQMGKAEFDLGGGRTLVQGLSKAHKLHVHADAGAHNPGSEINRGEYRLMVNLDVANTAFYKEQSCLKYLGEIVCRRATEPIPPRLSNHQYRSAKSAFETVLVETTYGPRKQRFEVKSLSERNARQQMFEKDDGTSWSVFEYFKDIGITLQYPDLPLLMDKKPLMGLKAVQERKKKELYKTLAKPLKSQAETRYYPIELCDITGNQRVARNKMKDASLTSAMIKKTAVGPQRRYELLQRLMREAGLANDPYLKFLGIERLLSFVNIVGRIIDAPKMRMLNSSKDTVEKLNVVRSVFQTDRYRYLVPGHVDKYGIISLEAENNDFLPIQAFQKFCEVMVAAGRAKGISFNENYSVELNKVRVVTQPQRPSVEDAAFLLDQVFEYQLKNEPGVTFFFVILPKCSRAEGPYWRCTKRIAAHFGIITQCIMIDNAAKIVFDGQGKQRSLVQNVLHKLNAKLGGVNWGLFDGSQRLTRYLSEFEPTMFIGADVSHPPPKLNKDALEVQPSIAAVVASADTQQWAYYPAARIQEPRMEYIDRMDLIVKDQLENFMNRNGMLPSRIVFFRDGVGEGMYREVMDREVNSIKRACDEYGPDYSPPITFILVLKRHHTRFFKADHKNPKNLAKCSGKDAFDNIEPGTVVDTGLVHPTLFEFFLCSHQGIKGTSRPTKYTVLYDENNFDADTLQSLTYYMCHVYHTCSRAVSQPAPAYMAHSYAKHITEVLLDFVRSKQVNQDGQSETSASSVLDYDFETLQEQADKYTANFKNRLFHSAL